jgi:hypothetical protein
MNTALIALLAFLFGSALASGEEWKRWPSGADEFATTIAVPPGFKEIRWRPPSPATQASLLLGGRFRSADGKAEFAVAVYYVRALPSKAEARRIRTTPASGEKVGRQKSNRKKFSGEHGPYWGYDEEMTIEGKGYTRYLLNSFSTGTLPGAASILWELRVADDDARKRYAAAWRRFKDSLEIGED